MEWSYLLSCLHLFRPLAVPPSPTFCVLLLPSLSRGGGERACLKSPELGRPAVVGEVETCPAQLLTELAETCYLQLVVMLEDPL